MPEIDESNNDPERIGDRFGRSGYYTLIAPKPLLQERFGRSGISLPEPFRESLLPFVSLGAISRSIHNQGNTNPFPTTKELRKQTENLLYLLMDNILDHKLKFMKMILSPLMLSIK